MGKTAIVTTSINAAPVAYRDWATAGFLVVAGDLNSPPELEAYVKDLGGVYLAPEWQERFKWSDSVGWQNIQRRNAAIMWALQQRGEFDNILTVDDDNISQHSASEFVKGHADALGNHDGNIIGSKTGWLNTGIFCRPRFHQRGTPYGVVTDGATILRRDTPTEIVVSQAQVLGDPDCDAVERMVNHPTVQAVSTNAVVSPGVYAAFNSQATLWRRDWAPVMAVLPGIGRYDDIFASFLFARLARAYNVTFHVGTPCVVQRRNEHNLVKDLAAELWGMNNVFSFVNLLNGAHISRDMPLWQSYSELIYATASVLPRSTIDFANRWVDDWRKL